MAYLILESFGRGLDARRMSLMSPPGSLKTAKNVHINRGGEIEKSKAFVVKYVLPPGTRGLHAIGGNLYVFGEGADPGVPGGVNYQRLEDPDASAMDGVLATESFNGKIYAIAEFADGSVNHFYDGARVTDWDTIAADVASNADVASALATKINTDSPHSASAIGEIITITAGSPGTPFTIAQNTINGGAENDQSITLTEIQANQEGVAEVLATGSFAVTGGTAAAPGFNQVATVTVDGVDILGAPVDWATSNSQTAAAVAAQINSNVSSPEYSATSNGPTVIISAAPGTGSGPNGFVVGAAVAGDVTVGEETNMAGGVDAVAAQAQQYTAEIGGTFEAGDTFTITLDGVDYTVQAASAGTGRTARTLGRKLYSTTLSLLYFSEIDNPSKFSSANGSGFINISNQDGGSEELVALGVYQNRIAVFARRSVQIWDIDPDPALNAQFQVLPNIGTIASRSVVSYGETDVFFLSDSGIRSLKARDSSNLASVNDLGTPIDPLVIKHLRQLTEDQARDAVAAIEPVDSRYWLALGDKIYAFSFFPGPKISAWSVYEPGLSFDAFAVVNKQIYARAGDVIYLYGGDDGDTYDTSEAVVETPYLDGRTIATWKDWEGIDLILEGLWTVYINTNPEEPDEWEIVAITNRSTVAQLTIPLEGVGPVVKLKFVTTATEEAKIAGAIVHYMEIGAS